MTAVPSISIKGIAVGALVDLVLSFALGFGVLILAIMQPIESSGDGTLGASNIAAYFVPLVVPPIVAGYATAIVARRQKLINAILTGILCASVAFLIDGVLRGLAAAWNDGYFEELAVFPLSTFLGGCLGLAIGWPSALTRIAAGPRRRIVLIIAAQTLIAISAGFALMTLLSVVFIGLPGAWLALAIFSFALLGCLKWLYRFRDAPWFAAAALFGLALQVAAFVSGLDDPLEPSLFELLGACAGGAVLSYFAQRRFWLASVIAIPALAKAWCLFCVPAFDITNLEHLGWVLQHALPVPMAAFVGAALADLLRNIRRR